MLVTANQMKVSVRRLLTDPEFYLFGYEAHSGSSEFLIVEESLLEQAPFVDIRLEPYARGRFSVPTSELANLVGNEPGVRPRQHFIFHHAFVCSTLLARCLAHSGAFFSLKEPQILRRLSDLKVEAPRAGPTDPGWGRLVSTHLRLLAKDYSRGGQVVVKASNVANNLVEDVVQQAPDSRLLYVHSTLPQFLVANLKKPHETRDKIPALLTRVAGYADFLDRCPRFRDLDSASFLQACAVLWLCSHHNFFRHAGHSAESRARTLAMNDFLERPAATLDRVCRLFGHEPSAEELARMTAGDVLQRHAKDPRRPYDCETREAENTAVFRRHAREIRDTVAWLEPACEELDIGNRLRASAL